MTDGSPPPPPHSLHVQPLSHSKGIEAKNLHKSNPTPPRSAINLAKHLQSAFNLSPVGAPVFSQQRRGGSWEQPSVGRQLRCCTVQRLSTFSGSCLGLIMDFIRKETVFQVCQPEYSPAILGPVMIECINPRLSCLPAGAGSQRRHRVRRGRTTSGDVLWKAQHAHQHSDRPLGTRPIRNQELRRNQRGCAAVLPGGESL